MPTTFRFSLLLSPQERKAITTKAKAAGISAGELLRRGAAAYEVGTAEETAELRALIDTFNTDHTRAMRCIDQNQDATAKALARMQREDVAREQSRARQ